MTKNEVIDQLESLLGHCKTMRESGEIWARDCEALRIARAALRGPMREQVEKMWRGEWKTLGAAKYGKPGVHYCTKCEECHPYKHNFCPDCGSPMTDEAVDIVVERLEALKDETAAN